VKILSITYFHFLKGNFEKDHFLSIKMGCPLISYFKKTELNGLLDEDSYKLTHINGGGVLEYNTE